ncbi:hypothetical protein [Phaeodactylibacter xiamenensis]|mgnify:CR=1 FL=1|jgi:polyribonucleotide nucleotidyltransferase|uniref:hypothetical protein n=1 Tax=Phaeodactylibacter xiamenensis TaxID=1524460 RepID=UPI0024A7CE09|nr:hypothetical protein [Phaeodactylibacter xiamenensis]
MKLLNLYKNQEFEAEILKVMDEDLKEANKSNQFEFDWIEEKKKQCDIFKIVIKDQESKILGLISLTDINTEFRIHINLVEVSNDNKGKNKRIDRIAGCLLAFACKVAFEKGYLGFASLVPKTELVGLYIKKYGFKKYGSQLAIDQRDAIGLIQKYL